MSLRARELPRQRIDNQFRQFARRASQLAR
jgi:hypothetical protein